MTPARGPQAVVPVEATAVVVPAAGTTAEAEAPDPVDLAQVDRELVGPVPEVPDLAREDPGLELVDPVPGDPDLAQVDLVLALVDPDRVGPDRADLGLELVDPGLVVLDPEDPDLAREDPGLVDLELLLALADLGLVAPGPVDPEPVDLGLVDPDLVDLDLVAIQEVQEDPAALVAMQEVREDPAALVAMQEVREVREDPAAPAGVQEVEDQEDRVAQEDRAVPAEPISCKRLLDQKDERHVPCLRGCGLRRRESNELIDKHCCQFVVGQVGVARNSTPGYQFFDEFADDLLGWQVIGVALPPHQIRLIGKAARLP